MRVPEPRGRERGGPAHPTPFGVRAVTGRGISCHSWTLLRNGYAREAAGLAVATADRVFPGVPALAVVRRDNIPSRRVVTGIGMTHLRETTLNGGPRMVFGFPAP